MLSSCGALDDPGGLLRESPIPAFTAALGQVHNLQGMLNSEGDSQNSITTFEVPGSQDAYTAHTHSGSWQQAVRDNLRTASSMGREMWPLNFGDTLISASVLSLSSNTACARDPGV